MGLIDLIPLPVRIAVAVVAFAASAMAGWTARGWKEDAARLEVEQAAHENYRKITAGWASAAQIITAGREADRQQAAEDRRKWQKERDDAKREGSLVLCGTGLRSDAPAAASGGDPHLSGRALGLWNGALDVGLPAAIRTWRTDGGGAGTDLPGPVTFEDALDNHAANSEQCNELRGRLLAWQEWARSIGAAE